MKNLKRKYNTGVKQYFYNGFNITIERNKYKVSCWQFITLENAKAFIDSFLINQNKLNEKTFAEK